MNTTEQVTVPRVGKVLCYVVRDGRLLVFRHRDHPDAGVQVLAGTLLEGEDPEVGAIRETEEETGHRGFRIVARLGVFDHEFRTGSRVLSATRSTSDTVFHLEPPTDLPESWSHLAEEGNGDFWFEYRWVPLTAELRLAGEQHAYLGAVLTG